MMGMELMIKSLGLDPEKLQNQISAIVADVERASKELERQGRLLDAISEKLGVHQPKEIDHAE